MKLKSVSVNLGIEYFGDVDVSFDLEEGINDFVAGALDDCDVRDNEFNLYVVDDANNVVCSLGSRHTVSIKSSIVVKMGLEQNKKIDTDEYSVYEANGNISKTTATKCFGKNFAYDEASRFSTISHNIIIMKSKNNRILFRDGYPLA